MKGINLYRRSLKSVPRELFYHPLAGEITWLNLASNALVYNNNGIFKNIDKVSLSECRVTYSVLHKPYTDAKLYQKITSYFSGRNSV